MTIVSIRRAAAAMAAALGAVFLTGCLLTPGAFVSELRLTKDGGFSFSYVGQIQMADLASLLDPEPADTSFTATCYDDDIEGRPCTDAEIAEQREVWKQDSVLRAENERKERGNMRTLFGGIDPRDAEGARALAARLERQRGWDKVTYIGDGMFDVEFRITGRRTHNFSFPLIEGVPLLQPFLMSITRDKGEVRVEAPGFVPLKAGSPKDLFLPMATRAEADNSEDGAGQTRIAPSGRFVIVTDGRILANNTDEGPAPAAGGQQLEWAIGSGTANPPMALIAFD